MLIDDVEDFNALLKMFSPWCTVSTPSILFYCIQAMIHQHGGFFIEGRRCLNSKMGTTFFPSRQMGQIDVMIFHNSYLGYERGHNIQKWNLLCTNIEIYQCFQFLLIGDEHLVSTLTMRTEFSTPLLPLYCIVGTNYDRTHLNELGTVNSV